MREVTDIFYRRISLFGSQFKFYHANYAASEKRLGSTAENQAKSKLIMSDTDLDREMRQHAQQLKQLAQSDPEFYKFMQENDADALDFEQDLLSEDDHDDDEDQSDGEYENFEDKAEINEDHEDDEDADDMEVEVEESKAKTLDIATVREWKRLLLESHSKRILRDLVKALECAVHSNDADQDVVRAYKVTDENVYAEIISVSLELVPATLDFNLTYEPSAVASKVLSRLPSSCERWSKLELMARSFIKSFTHLLSLLDDPNTTVYILKSLVRYGGINYLCCMSKKKVSRVFLQRILHTWTAASDVRGEDIEDDDESVSSKGQQSETSETVRITAFLVLQRMVTSAPRELVDRTYRGLLRAFIIVAKDSNKYTMPIINFASNCIVELFDAHSDYAYQHVFTSIRQLAISLRNAITQQSTDTTKALYNWQILQCIRLWCRVVGNLTSRAMTEGAKENPFAELVYPLYQVSIGIAKFLPSHQYLPFRLHIFCSLAELVRKTGHTTPLASFLSSTICEIAVATTKWKPSSLKPLDFSLHYRAPNNYLHTRQYVENSGELFTKLLLQHLADLSKDIAFPEIVVPLVMMLKKVKKISRSIKLTKSVSAILDKIEQTRALRLTQRQSISHSVTDISEYQVWQTDTALTVTPLQAYLAVAEKIGTK